jgi:hypothetical protein
MSTPSAATTRIRAADDLLGKVTAVPYPIGSKLQSERMHEARYMLTGRRRG